ncbi:MAG: MBL fold metallo-hydrolase [Chloroflexota bacterium]|nr:MBL fold metallo-hydrolase [Chloroflexota bacterium]
MQLSSHLYVVLAEFPHRSSANAYLITGKQLTLIDCGSQAGFPVLARSLSQISVEIGDITQVIATHGHYDHIQGIHSLRQHRPDLPLLIHERDWRMVQSSDPYRTAAVVYGRDFTPIPAEGCRALVEGEEIAAGDGSLTVHHTPGHTDGSICLAGSIDGVDVLFTGDTVFGAMSGLLGADITIWTRAFEAWHQSLTTIASLDFDIFLPGHEPFWDLPLKKERLTRVLPYFGRMFNPWFALSEDESGAPDNVVLPQVEPSPDAASTATSPSP